MRSSIFEIIEIRANFILNGQGGIKGLYFTKTLDPQF